MKPTIDEVNKAKAEANRLWKIFHDLENTPEIKAAQTAWWKAENQADNLLKEMLSTEEPKP